MVAGIVWFPVLNQMFADYDGDGRMTARRAVDGATSVHDAIERANLYETLAEDMATEARAVIGALPPEVDRQIVSSLSDAFERDVPVTIEWQEHTEITVEVTSGDAPNEVHIILRTPAGREFL
jgi:hypothetical protein